MRKTTQLLRLGNGISHLYHQTSIDNNNKRLSSYIGGLFRARIPTDQTHPTIHNPIRIHTINLLFYLISFVGLKICLLNSKSIRTITIRKCQKQIEIYIIEDLHIPDSVFASVSTPQTVAHQSLIFIIIQLNNYKIDKT